MPQASYKPSAFYFRRELAEAKTLAEARCIGRRAILELEELKAWVRKQGLIPPKFYAPESEISEKGWLTEPKT
jgi:hypothetical protein